jgi:hypothetical protein
MIICEVNKAAMHQVKLERQKESDAIQAELDAYKIEYDRLYEDTMPDLIYLFIYLFIRRENKDEMEQMLKVWQDNSMCERYVFYIRCE